MSSATEHIAAWQAAGIIDEAMADRLRAADAVEPGSIDPAPTVAPIAKPSSASTMFGPGVTIAEVFAYLGIGFIFASWSAFIASAAGTSSSPGIVIGIGESIAAAVLVALGLGLRRGDARRSRAAGVAFLLAVSSAGGAAGSIVAAAGLDWPVTGVLASAVALAVAIAVRAIHPSVLTQLGLLGALTALSGTTLAWAQTVVAPDRGFDPSASVGGPDPLLLLVASAVWWLVTAVAIGLIGLREARSSGATDDPAAARRAAVTRFWAGLVAVIGLATAVIRTQYSEADGNVRVLEPWIGDLALIVLSLILVERAFRRDATSFIYAASLGLLIALSDINLSYLSEASQGALLVEGMILLGVGFAADRLRRRVGRSNGGPVEPGGAAPGEDPALTHAPA